MKTTTVFSPRHCQPEDVFGDITPSLRATTTGRIRADAGPVSKSAADPAAAHPADNLWSRVAHARSNKQRPRHPEENLRNGLRSTAYRHAKSALRKYTQGRQLLRPLQPVHCLFTEDLFSSRADQTLQELCSFLSITGAPAAQHDFTQNRGSYHPLPEDLRARAVQQFSASFAFAAKHMGRVPDSWAKDMDAYL